MNRTKELAFEINKHSDLHDIHIRQRCIDQAIATDGTNLTNIVKIAEEIHRFVNNDKNRPNSSKDVRKQQK